MFRLLLSRVMIWGVLFSAAVMLVGGVVYVAKTPGAKPGDHVFHGEPADLRSPVSIVEDAMRGHTASIIQVGVLLLLLNPFIRVAFSVAGYAVTRDPLYAGISLAVFAVLTWSFFL